MNKEQQFLKLALQELKWAEEVKKLTYKEIADYCIQNIWSKMKVGTKEIAVMDRIIEMLFVADEVENEKQKK